MAVSIAAGNKEHSGRCDARNEKGIVVGAADHFEKSEPVLAAGIGQGCPHFRGAICRRISIEQYRLNRDLALREKTLAIALDQFHYTIAPRLIGVADIEGQVDAARDT